MTRSMWGVVSMVMAVALTVSACGSDADSPTGGGQIAIGESIGISGPAGAYGKGKLDGQLAMVKAINAAGGVKGKQLNLTYLDDGFDPARAVQNVKKLVAQGSVALLSGSGSGSIDASVPIAAQGKVPLVFPARTNPEWVRAGFPHVFSIIPTFRDQSAAIVKHAFETTGPGSVFYVATQSVGLAETLADTKKAAESGGGSWLGSTEVPFGASDIMPFALQAGKNNPDYILFASAPAETIKIVSALAAAKKLPAKGILGLTSMPGTAYLTGVPADAVAKTVSFSATVPPSAPGAKACDDAMRAHLGKPADLVNLSGCNEVQLLASAVERIDGEVTRQSLTMALNLLSNAEISPMVPPVSYSQTRRMGLTALPVVSVKDGQYVQDGTAEVPVLGQ